MMRTAYVTSKLLRRARAAEGRHEPGGGRPHRSIPRLALAGLVVISGALSSLALGARPAAADSLVTTLCSSYAYACDSTGYHGQSAWSWFVGPHNCTNYAAWRLHLNGVPQPAYNLGNAATWASRAQAAGVPVNAAPAVGAIAQWNAYTAWADDSYGHVGYVQSVGPNYIEVVADNYPGSYDHNQGHMDTTRFYVGSKDWPSNFIHFKDVSSGSDFLMAFQANTTQLWTAGPSASGANSGLGMMPGTSPSVVRLAHGGYEEAFQANTGHLWLVGAQNIGDTGYGMRAGTSPSIAALTNGSFEVAFQANTGYLWLVGSRNIGDTGYGMMAGTSPSIAGLTNGSFEVAFQANTGVLWLVGSQNVGDTHYGMKSGTSPSVAGLTNGSFEVAFQANTGVLWLVGSQNVGDTGLGMYPGTSPSIAALATGGYKTAFEANTTQLWTANTAGVGTNTYLGMLAGTSPSITGLGNGGYEVAIQANTGTLYTFGTARFGDTGLGMKAGTSPSIAG